MNKKAKPLPMEIIRESLELDPASPSWLRWKIRPWYHFSRDRDWKIWNTRFAGQVIESVATPKGGKKYWRLSINDTSYHAHRIVYALIHGTDPGSLHIDHIDGNGLNNAPENLRLATCAENQHNRGANRNNSSGHKGVNWDKQAGKWRAKIKLHGHTRHIGYFHSIDDAAAAYARTAEALHGDFARTA